MQINPKSVKKHFEKSMAKYNANAVVQKILAQKLVDALCGIRKDFTTVLETGCGTGLLTEELIKRINYKNYYANDITPKAELYTAKILKEYVFIEGDARKVKPSRKADLIISNALFQWFENIEKVCEYYKTLLNNDGILAFSTFSPDNFKEIKKLAGLSLDYLPLRELKKSVEKSFDILFCSEFEYKMNFNSPLELLAHMKNTGVNSLSEKHLTFSEVKNFCDNYKKTYPDVTLTYSPIIIIAKLRS